MHSFVVNVGAKTLGGVEAIPLSLGRLTETLLLIADVMLGTCNDTGILNASDGRVNQGTGQIWVRTEAFL